MCGDERNHFYIPIGFSDKKRDFRETFIPRVVCRWYHNNAAQHYPYILYNLFKGRRKSAQRKWHLLNEYIILPWVEYAFVEYCRLQKKRNRIVCRYLFFNDANNKTSYEIGQIISLNFDIIVRAPTERRRHIDDCR